MERSQFTFYRSFWDAIKELPAKSKAEVVCAICAYALEGEAPKLSGTSKAIFTLIKPTLDASARKAEIGKLGGSKEKAKDKQSESKGEAEQKQTVRENEKENEIENENEVEKEGENECSPPIGGPPHSPKKKYGQYGWVRLTQDEYSRLKKDLGESEFNRCIEYVDESAQKSGNKNRWKDWNLVIRNCHRDGWGLNKYGKQMVSVPHNSAPTVEEAQRMERLLARMEGRDAG